MNHIKWFCLAKPQNDEYDSKIILELAHSKGYVRQQYPKHPTYFNTQIAMLNDDSLSAYSGCVPAPYNHYNLKAGWEILSLWQAAFKQFRYLTESISIFINTRLPVDSVTGSICGRIGNFGRTTITINGYVNFAEGLVHEMAHQKLWALGVDFNDSQKLINNSPEQTYPSPIRYDCMRPMSAILHAQYSYTHVAALDIAILQSTHLSEQDKIKVAKYLSSILPKLEFGYKVIEDNVEADEAGVQFLDGLFSWLDDIFDQGYSLLEQLKIEPKPFIHPLLKQITPTYPCKRSDLQEHDLKDELIIYSEEQEMGFSFNKSSKAIWELCDGEHTLNDIAEKIGQSFGCSGNFFLEDIHTAVAQFRELGLLQ